MKLSGVMPALVTPFDKADKIDFKAFEGLLTHFREAGVSGWVPNGSTGEYFSMSTEERRSVLEFVKDFANDDDILIAGANAPATREVIEQTQIAKDVGYDTVLLAPPFYTRPTQDELIRHYETVMDAVDVNIVLYSYPAKDGADISFELMDHFAANPRVLGIKESSGVMQRAIDITSRYEGKIQLVSGSDDIALDFMFWGADSWICGPSNCMAKACCDLDRTYRSGDLCRANDIPVFEKNYSLYEAYGADEAFLTGTFGAQTSVAEIDGKSIGTGVRPMTQRIRALYKELIAGL
jgi:4-hydroxy-tetrahydrodipicolinate synthase